MKLIHYNYIYLDQRKPGRWEFRGVIFDFEPFYVGMGKKDRIDHHLTPSSLRKNSYKNNVIKAIRRETGEDPVRFRVFKNISLYEANENEAEMIKHFGRKDKGMGPLANLRDGGNSMTEEDTRRIGISNQKKSRSRGASTPYTGVTIAKGNILCNATIDGKRFYRRFDDLEAAAQAYDKLVLFIYGVNAKINFPENLENYKLLDLEDFCKKFQEPVRKKASKYSYVVRSQEGNKNDWLVTYTLIKKLPNLRLGSFESEESAARAVDKILFYLKDSREKFNFPTEAENLTYEEVDRFIKSKTFIRTNKYPGVNKSGRKWVALAYIDSIRLTIGSYESEETAKTIRLLYIEECEKESPSMEVFENIKLYPSAIKRLEDKILLNKNLSER